MEPHDTLREPCTNQTTKQPNEGSSGDSNEQIERKNSRGGGGGVWAGPCQRCTTFFQVFTCCRAAAVVVGERKMLDCDAKQVRLFDGMRSALCFFLGVGGQIFTRGAGGGESSLNDKQLFPSAEEQTTDGEEWQQKWKGDSLEMKIDTRFCEVSLDT